MSNRFTSHRWLPSGSVSLLMLSVVCAFLSSAVAAEKSEKPGETEKAEKSEKAEKEVKPRLIDQYPFDRITLDAANDNAVIDVQLIEFPNRQVPNPFPTNGSLEIRRLSDPTKLYTINWSAIDRIDLYENLVLREAQAYLSAGKLNEAYTDLEFLHKNYPNLVGLQQITENYLQRDALDSYSKKQYDESLAILSALYDVNAQRKGLTKAVEGVSNRFINELLANQDYTAARKILDSLDNQFSQLQLTNLASWQNKFESDSQTQLAIARQAIAQQDYSSARQAVRRAIAILPDIPEAQELLAKIDHLALKWWSASHNFRLPSDHLHFRSGRHSTCRVCSHPLLSNWWELEQKEETTNVAGRIFKEMTPG